MDLDDGPARLPFGVSSMRGRLIFPFGIEICRLDTVATDAAPGYDPVFREPKLVSTVDGLGAPGRKEMTPIVIPGQFAIGSDFMLLQMVANGNVSKTDFKIVFHFSDLEELGLIETATNTSLIRVGDRLSGIYDINDGSLVQAVSSTPGVCIKEAEPHFGLGNSRNLLVCTFVSRDQGQT